jgi:hypothetical protein
MGRGSSMESEIKGLSLRRYPVAWKPRGRREAFRLKIWQSSRLRVASPSWLDLDVRGRTLFGGLYLAAQAALVLSSPLRPDRVFSFQMFNESSTITIQLSRRVLGPDGRVLTVPTDGKWEARDEDGGRRWFSWNDRVRDPILGTLGRPVHASYGVGAQLFRLQRALDDAMAHTPHDTETRALVADVRVSKNGREPYGQRLESARPTE